MWLQIQCWFAIYVLALRMVIYFWWHLRMMQQHSQFVMSYCWCIVLMKVARETAVPYCCSHNVSTFSWHLQGAALKNDPTPKLWLLSNSWKFLRQILYACSAGSCPLMCCFSRKLLYMYEIDIMPNFKFEFCNCTSLFLRDVTFNKNYFQIYWKKTGCWTP